MNEYTVHETLVNISNVSLTLGGNPILAGVSHEIKDIKRAGRQQGQVVCLLGPSGVGKTQLFRCISGLQSPTSGHVLIGTDQKPVKAGDVGVVPQQYTLFRHRKVLGNLLVAAAQRGTAKEEATEAAMGYLKRFGIEDKANLYPAQLSGGQRQRVAIIQQLLSSGHFLLMDEPFSGLDPIMKIEAMELINDVASQNDFNTIVVTTHDVESAISIADQLLLLGKNVDADGKNIGSSIKKIYDLAAMGMAWRPDLSDSAEYFELSKKIYVDFKSL
jgi:ABC-type nitrate/sulfonate/bicarbonate transport system ATPase subunit